ncbi:hypothetical protein [Luteibacter sp. E-22]
MSEKTDTDTARTPQDYDKSTGNHVEKKPGKEESPQQTHNNEDHG